MADVFINALPEDYVPYWDLDLSGDEIVRDASAAAIASSGMFILTELTNSKIDYDKYLKYAKKELSPLNVYISADIYGLVGSVSDDMGLGQYWEAVSNIVDYVSPMMYPSHYGNGVYGLSVPDAFPYETIDIGTKDALIRNKNIQTPATIRPWIQDFTASWVKGHIKYGPEEVRKQIKALEDNGVKEYLLWNPNNRYSEDGVK